MTANSVISQEIEVPSSFNPVGSGARAIGMGGAFIGIADDATAASWNPGGLIQMHKAQASFVLSHFHRNEIYTKWGYFTASIRYNNCQKTLSKRPKKQGHW